MKRENLIALAESCVGSGAGRNFLYNKLGKHLLNAKIAYIQNSAPKEPLHPSLKNSDIDDLISFFKRSKEISYQVLWDVPTSVEKTMLVSSITSGEKRHEEIIDHNGDPNMVQIQDTMYDAWRQENINPESSWLSAPPICPHKQY